MGKFHSPDPLSPMPLTDVQKQKILRYAGWPDLFIQENKRFFASTINKRLTDISPAAEADAIALLNRCIDIDAQLGQAVKRLSATSIGNIRLNRREISSLRAERRRIIEEMKTTLFLFPPEHYFPEVY